MKSLQPHETIESFKLSSIKGEARYTTNAMMYKLNCHYEISKVGWGYCLPPTVQSRNEEAGSSS